MHRYRSLKVAKQKARKLARKQLKKAHVTFIVSKLGFKKIVDEGFFYVSPNEINDRSIAIAV